jgi:hypothetical protein
MMTRDNARLWLGALIAPVIPITVVATWYWINTGNRIWFPLLFTFGYIFTFVFGLPIMGILIARKKFFSCLVGGGAASVLPVILLAMFSIFSENTIFNSEMIEGGGVLFISGCAGGALFWLIAFSGSERKSGGGDNSKIRG